MAVFSLCTNLPRNRIQVRSLENDWRLFTLREDWTLEHTVYIKIFMAIHIACFELHLYIVFEQCIMCFKEVVISYVVETNMHLILS